MSISSKVRERLKAEGKWDRYVECRERLNGYGYTSAEIGMTLVEAIDAGTEEKCIERLIERKFRDGEPIVPEAPAGPLSKKSPCMKKRATPNEIQLWVMRNFLVEDLKPEDAPDMVAWTLLDRCRTNAEFANQFMSSGFQKLLSAKGDGGEDDPDKFDGKREYDILARMKELEK